MKQVIVIRKDLGMRRGKEIAQGAHAAMAFMSKVICDKMGWTSPYDLETPVLTQEVMQWVAGNFRKVVLQARTYEEFKTVYEAAKKAGLVVNMIEDTGLTEFHGELTETAFAIGPHSDEEIDAITGRNGTHPLDLY